MESSTDDTNGESQGVQPYNSTRELVASSSCRREMMDSSTSFHPEINDMELSFHSLDKSSSWRNVSISSSLGNIAPQVVEDIESGIVERAGDDGYSRSRRSLFEVNELHSIENGVGTLPNDLILQFYSSDASMLNVMLATTPVTDEIIGPLSSDGFICSRDNNCGKLQKQNMHGPEDNQKKVPWLLENIACLFHLAVFGILGVASFLMGWLGIVFKANISHVSNLLALGLTTGFLGSLTTFSGWNQKMLELAADGRWVVSIAGYIIGSMKWVPFGTLLANVIAASLNEALATTKKVVNTKRYEIVVDGIQLGFVGNLSTVSTFVAEIHAIVHSQCPWRATIYVALTVVPSFALGTLLYCVPVWTKGY